MVLVTIKVYSTRVNRCVTRKSPQEKKAVDLMLVRIYSQKADESVYAICSEVT